MNLALEFNSRALVEASNHVEPRSQQLKIQDFRNQYIAKVKRAGLENTPPPSPDHLIPVREYTVKAHWTRNSRYLHSDAALKILAQKIAFELTRNIAKAIRSGLIAGLTKRRK